MLKIYPQAQSHILSHSNNANYKFLKGRFDSYHFHPQANVIDNGLLYLVFLVVSGHTINKKR